MLTCKKKDITEKNSTAWKKQSIIALLSVFKLTHTEEFCFIIFMK